MQMGNFSSKWQETLHQYTTSVPAFPVRHPTCVEWAYLTQLAVFVCVWWMSVEVLGRNNLLRVSTSSQYSGTSTQKEFFRHSTVWGYFWVLGCTLRNWYCRVATRGWLCFVSNCTSTALLRHPPEGQIAEIENLNKCESWIINSDIVSLRRIENISVCTLKFTTQKLLIFNLFWYKISGLYSYDRKRLSFACRLVLVLVINR